MGYTRRGLASDERIEPGKLYEFVFTVKSGDASRLSKDEIQSGMRSTLKDSRIEVQAWKVQGASLLVTFWIPPTSATAQVGDEVMVTPMLVPVLLVAAVVAALIGLFMIWKISVAIKETVELVPNDVKEKIAVGVASAGAGIGLLGLGVAYWLMWPRKKSK